MNKDTFLKYAVLYLAVALSFFGCVTDSKVNGYLANHPAKVDSILTTHPCIFKVDSTIAAKVDTNGIIGYLQSLQPPCPPQGNMEIFPVTPDDYNQPPNTYVHYVSNPTIRNNGKIQKIDTAAILKALSKFYTPTVKFEADERTIIANRSIIADKVNQIAILNKGLTDTQLNDKKNLDAANASRDKWELYFWLLVTAIGVFTVVKIVLAFTKATPTGAAASGVGAIIKEI